MKFLLERLVRFYIYFSIELKIELKYSVCNIAQTNNHLQQ